MKISILGVNVDKTTKAKVLDRVRSLLEEKKKFYIVTPNPEIILKAGQNQKLKNALNNADISIPDGVGLKLSDISLNIVKGRELMMDIISFANINGYSVYFLGSTKHVEMEAERFVKTMYPDLKINGSSGAKLHLDAEPINDTEEVFEKQIIDEINKLKPDFLFVAFGAPKQELWLAKHIGKLKIGGAMVVGGTFDYLTDAKRKVPKLFSALGLEWLWRLVIEPKRIGRIWNAVVIFPVKLLVSKLFV